MPATSQLEQALLAKEFGGVSYTPPVTDYVGLIVATQWAASASVPLNTLVTGTAFGSSNRHIYKCTTAGTTASTEPAWNQTVGGTTTDGSVTWTEVSNLFAAGSFAGAEPAASRVDTCTTTAGSPTVVDTGITAADAGKPVSGSANVPANTYVGTVSVGASFLLSSSPTSQVNVSATATGSASLTIGTNYARVGVTNNQTTWPAPTGSDPASLTVVITYPQSTAPWGWAVGVVISDAASGGNYRAWGLLSQPLAVLSASITPSIPVAGLTITLT